MAGCYPQTMPAVFLSYIGLAETGKFFKIPRIYSLSLHAGVEDKHDFIPYKLYSQNTLKSGLYSILLINSILLNTGF